MPTIHAPNLQKVIAIVSTGRTGTKALATHLTAAYPDTVLALHEPPPTRFTLRRASNKALVGRATKEELTTLLTRHRQHLSTLKQTHYVESNPGLSGFLDVLPDVFPNLQILHVVRDPRTYIPSALNWGVYSGLKNLLVNTIPYWLPKPENVKPPSNQPPYAKMTPIQRLAWHWQLVNQFLDRGATLHPHQYHRIKFEDLFAKDGTGLAWFTHWANLPPTPNLAQAANTENINASKPGQSRKWSDWTPEEKQSLLQYCAPLMQSYGYDLIPDAHLLAAELRTAGPRR